MQKARVLYVSCVLVVVAIAGIIGITQKRFNSAEQLSSKATAAETKDVITASLLNDSRLIAFNRWSTEDAGGPNLSYIIRAFDQDPNYEGRGVKLTIFNDLGVLLYEGQFSWVNRVYPKYILRNGSPQLVMEVNYGGNTSFLVVLDYQDGKITNLTSAIKPNNDFGSNAEVRPQFRSGIHPAIEPYQIFLTQPGLASSAEKYTDVFRYRDGAYRYVGEFSQQKVDDYIEKLITQDQRK